MTPTDPRAPDPRSLALALLERVLMRGEMLSDPASAPESAARARRLAETTLRHLGRADAMLAPLLRKAPPPQVLTLLRLAVVEIHELGQAPHGVVHDAVARTRPQALQGMVNAVLRRAAEGTGWADLPPTRLPPWLRKPLVKAYGAEAVAAIEAAHQAGPGLDLTLKPGAEPPGGMALPGGGSWRLPRGGQVSALPGYAAGDWWVQDAAAALPATLIDGGRVLDICAAPGGKTMQLAAKGCDVTALDVSDARLARLRQNLTRTGLHAQVVCADALDWTPETPFDAVLLDAPCSATGTIRRHPELPHIRSMQDVAALGQLQARLIDRARAMLRPGGILVYCTCSLLPQEGEHQIRAALARHADLRAGMIALPIGRASGEGWRTRPDDLSDMGGVDGFFIARLIRE
jgi:16S rRNA (cytosine967-C5)-methyltransferase